MAKTPEPQRLSRNFHRTFKPERQYITALLRFAAAGSEGDHQAISAATGIPTGTSTGKVPAILDYCRGMGLVQLAGQERSAVKKPELTMFGRVLLLEDPYMKTGMSQWLCHLNLCAPRTGADVWFHTFFEGASSLGMSFEREKLESYLILVYGVEKAGLVGPLIGTYEDESAMRICGALTEVSGRIERRPAPIKDEFGHAYGAWLLQLISEHFPNTSQVSITELNARAGWRTIPGWDISSHQRVLELVERKGAITVDRHMEPWLIRPVLSQAAAWKRIYDDLL